MPYAFPKIELSEAELMWLRIISRRFLSGYLADVDQLKKSLRAERKWPSNFRPSEIDYRLYQRDNKPTLLGIWHADPENKWIAKLDELIRYIKSKLSITTEIKIDDIARDLQLSDLNVTILIHLLPSLGFGYTAVGKPSPRNTVTIPGQLGIYDRLQLDDPEKMDTFLSYDNLEAQVRKFYGDDSDTDESDRDLARTNADKLYEKVRSLMQSDLDEEKARIVVESADDAIRDYGSTNQERKVELRKWKSRAEGVLPPKTVKELRERTEGGLLRPVWRRPFARYGLMFLVAAALCISGIFYLRELFSEDKKSSSLSNSQTPSPMAVFSPLAIASPTIKPSPEEHVRDPKAEVESITLCIRYEESKSAFDNRITIAMGAISYEGIPLRHFVSFAVNSPGHKSLRYVRKENGDRLTYTDGQSKFEIVIVSVDAVTACFDVRRLP